MRKEDFEKVESVWANNEDSVYQNKISHHRKIWGGWDNWGQHNLSEIKRCFSFLNRELASMSIVEWGVGGGANMGALSFCSQNYIGIDISPSSLVASTEIAKEYVVPFTPVLIGANPEEDLLSYFDSADLFVSTAVFQHFPSKEYTFEVLKIVYNLLKTGGVGLIQIRYDNRDGSKKSRTIEGIEEYQEKYMTATSFTLEKFWEELKRVSLQPLYISNIVKQNQYANFIFTKGEFQDE